MSEQVISYQSVKFGATPCKKSLITGIKLTEQKVIGYIEVPFLYTVVFVWDTTLKQLLNTIALQKKRLCSPLLKYLFYISSKLQKRELIGMVHW